MNTRALDLNDALILWLSGLLIAAACALYTPPARAETYVAGGGAYKQAALPPQQAKPSTKTYTFNSGTGFYITKNHIVTNEHVVQGCRAIRVRGAVSPTDAVLLSTDPENDLALLRTTMSAPYVAPIRANEMLQVGEPVTVMGYPLDHGISGDYLIRKAAITDTNDPFFRGKRILFTNSVEKGNSGGPLLDRNGTVVGVVVGKVSYYLADSRGAQAATPQQTSSVAISLNTLKNFLNRNRVFYRVDNIQNYGFTDSWVENKAKNFIVNVHCVQ